MRFEVGLYLKEPNLSIPERPSKHDSERLEIIKKQIGRHLFAIFIFKVTLPKTGREVLDAQTGCDPKYG